MSKRRTGSSNRDINEKDNIIDKLKKDNAKLEDDLKIIKSALCNSCKFINLNQARSHLEQCERAKKSLIHSLESTNITPMPLKRNKSEGKTETAASLVEMLEGRPTRHISMPVNQMNKDNLFPSSSVPKPSVRARQQRKPRNTKSTKVVDSSSSLPSVQLPPRQKTPRQMKIAEVSDIESFLPDDPTDDSCISSSSHYSIDPEEELDILTDEDDFKIPKSDGYTADDTISDLSDSSTEFNSDYPPKLDFGVLIKQIRTVKHFLEIQKIQGSHDVLQIINNVEDSLCQAVLSQKSKASRKKQRYGRLLRLVKDPKPKPSSQLRRGSLGAADFPDPPHCIQVQPYSDPHVLEPEPKREYTEIQVRVDQTSLLNTNNSPDLQKPTRSATDNIGVPRGAKLVAPEKKKQYKRTRSNSLSRNDSNKDLTTQTPHSNETSQQRFLTFIIEEGGNKILKYGHILDILEWLVNHPEATTNDMKTFLFSFRIATSPLLLLNTLTVLYRFSYNPERSQQIVAMITLWVKYFYVIDFHSDSTLSTKLWEFVQTYIPSQNKTIRKLSSSWQNMHWDYIKESINGSNNSIPFTVDILDEEPRMIAEQLTVIEWELFKYFDIFDCFCKDKPQSKVTEKLVEQFNRISGWVASTILSQSRSKRRALYIKFFITVAKHLLEIKNFNGIMEITAGLDSISIGRLKKTWRVVQKHHTHEFQLLKRLNTLMSPKDNFKDYRLVIGEVPPPFIPFFGIISRDITLINVGNDTFVKNLVNFEKCGVLWKVCSRVLEMQKEVYSFQTMPMLNSYLTHIPIADEQTLYNTSITLEPIAGEAT